MFTRPESFNSLVLDAQGWGKELKNTMDTVSLPKEIPMLLDEAFIDISTVIFHIARKDQENAELEKVVSIDTPIDCCELFATWPKIQIFV